MAARQFFPLGKAYGQAFCNRVEETKKLIGNINSGKHTLLVAPRRYGKSSLCEHAFEQIDLPWAKLDFHLAVSEKDAEQIIATGVSELISKAIGSAEKLITIIKKFAKNLKPKLGIGSNEFHLELEFSSNGNCAENIAKALLLLEKLLRTKKRQAVLLFDEFQEIGEIDKGKAIEGAIRHVAQETKNLAFIFSGSNPHLLKNMFEDERRPLYKICRKLVLGRINANDYLAHFAKASKAAWNLKLENKTFERIMQLSERHPYYVNYLCDEVWASNDNLPTLNAIDSAWEMVIEEERSDLLKDFFTLSENQRKVMIHIANHGGKHILANDAAKKMDISVGSISRALTTLIEKDYLEKSTDGYRLIIPPYKQLLARKMQ